MKRCLVGFSVLALLLVLPLAGCSGQAASPPSQQLTEKAPYPAAALLPTVEVTPQAALPVTSSGQTIQVTISDDQFTPGDLTIPVGYTVIWINAGQHPHTVTADDGSFSSGPLQSGDTFQHTFDVPGVHDYFCEFHGESGRRGMYATVTVAAGSTPVANGLSLLQGQK